MKSIKILEDVAVSGTPKFKKNQEVRVSDNIAKLLIERGHATAIAKVKDEVKPRPKGVVVEKILDDKAKGEGTVQKNKK